MISPFFVHTPATLDDALHLVQEFGDEAKIMAGGSELVLLMKSGLLATRHVIDIKKTDGFGGIAADPEGTFVRIGALVTHRQIERSELIRKYFPEFADMEKRLANVRIRNVGTLAGNICFAEPHADPGTLLLAYGATVTCRSARGIRSVDIDDFFRDDYQTAVQADEIVTQIQIPRLGEGFRGTYLRCCPGERPIAGIAVLLQRTGGACQDARLAVGCVEGRPVRMGEVEEILRGKPLDELSAKAMEIGERTSFMCEPSSDIWGSVDYKRQIVKTLVSRGIQALCA
jgi:carbon-monoxide dehydrogenase medium subunit